MPWYRTGTVSVTLNSNAVIGTGTAFVANSRVGDAFLGPDGGWYEITNIASNTALSITPNYRGATNAVGVYALTPVQGYTKDLADQARAMIQQWGSTLAGLGSVSTENIVPVVKGGSGANTAAGARANLGLGSAAVAPIVGTVSQSGGIPTGAIIETGTNASGTYTKYADGTMIVSFRAATSESLSLTSQSNGYFYSNKTVTFPANFVAPPTVSNCTASAGTLTLPMYSAAISGNGATLFQGSPTSQASVLHFISYTAIGRWFA